jgi:sarcosine oxidase subunit alpha
MTQPFRTESGGRIRRDRPAGFSFDGHTYTGCEGDTLGSALLANGVHLTGRSFKYHRPRGILSAGSEEPNALVTLDRGAGRVTPNLRATQITLYEGLTARSQNRYPSLRFDLGALASLASPVLGAGFYYKTFMWPASFWRRVYEPAIRRAAGLGRAPTDPDPDRYAHQYAHCDMLVVGGGPAGLAAALSAAASGGRVILCDEQAEPGGSLLAEPDATIDGVPAGDWLARTLETLAGRVTILPRTTAFGVYPDMMVGLVQLLTDHLPAQAEGLPRERLWQIRARQVVLAAGAIQRPLVFPHNDRPGVMLADPGRIYLQRYGVRVGGQVVVATAEDSAYRAALALHRAGVRIAAILDQRSEPASALTEAALAAGIPVQRATVVTGTKGRLRVRSVSTSGPVPVLPCDTVLTSGGWTPSVHLFAQARGRLRFDDVVGAFVPAEPLSGVQVVGACAGTFDLAACLAQGYAAGEALRPTPSLRRFVVGGTDTCGPAGPPLQSPPHGKAFVDLQNDVTTADLAIATQEGFRAIEHVKRYTTAGMATDQGKTSNVNTLAIVAGMLDQPVQAVGHTTYRPPYTPVTFGTLAGAARGALLDPLRQTPLHEWAVQYGATFEDAGTWRRVRCFPRQGETVPQAVARECRAVRNAVGMLDASTLGKIEVVGPDAGLFLDRLYTGNFSRLSPGRCRYGVLLGEDGFVRDDGVIARIGHGRYHVTTTTGGAAFVMHHMEDYLQTEFPELRVWLTSTTEHWAVIAVQGPRAADVLGPITQGIALATMPAMAVREGKVAGIPARVFSVSFTGERGFEVNVPAAHAHSVWDALLAAGVTPYGTEAMHVLRAEQGFILVGQETDGTVTPDDLGLGWTIARDRSDFVGKRSLAREDPQRADRKQLVGLLTTDPSVVLEEGAQIVAATDTTVSLGHVTSSYRSETLGRSIALALVAAGRTRIGSRLSVAMPHRPVAVEVTEPRFLRGSASATAGADQAIRPDVSPAPAAAAPARSAHASPLHAVAATSPACTQVRLTELAATTRIVVRAERTAATAIGRSLGVLLGAAPNRAVVASDRAALWLGPDEWLVFAPASDTDLARAATLALGPIPASVVDVSHRSVSIELAGPYAAWCLNGFCALDLDTSAFSPGMATRTLFAKAEIVLWRTGAETFHIEIARSYASYVWACLEEARREFLDPGSG